MTRSQLHCLILAGLSAGVLMVAAPKAVQAQDDRHGDGERHGQMRDDRYEDEQDEHRGPWRRDPGDEHGPGRGHGYGHRHDDDGYGRVTSIDGMVAVRDAFNRGGYVVVGDRWAGDSRIVYYRRGHGYGPVQQMIIRPSGPQVLFDAAPDDIVADLRIRLHL